MTLTYPVEIAPNLEPGVRIGNSDWVTIAYSKRKGSEGRVRYKYTIIRSKCKDVVGHDLQSGRFEQRQGLLRRGLENLLGFLSAFAEDCNPSHKKHEDDNSDLFPSTLKEWAYLNSDEISIRQCEVDENKNCIME